MDDILVLAPTRWKLRKAFGLVNQTLDALLLEKHPDKTFIGKVCRGFDFLGYRLSEGISVARVTVDRFVERVSRLSRGHGRIRRRMVNRPGVGRNLCSCGGGCDWLWQRRHIPRERRDYRK
jgi:hypothetical protein